MKIESWTPITSKNPNTVPLDSNTNQTANCIPWIRNQVPLFENLNIGSQIKHHPYPLNPNTALQWFDSTSKSKTTQGLGLDLFFLTIRTSLLVRNQSVYWTYQLQNIGLNKVNTILGKERKHLICSNHR